MNRAPLAAATALLVAAACRSPQPPVPLPPTDERPARAVEGLARDARARWALRGVARLAVEGPAGAGRAKQVVIVERPARLRVEVLGFLDQTVAVLATDGARYRLFRAEDRSLTEGPVYPALLEEVVGVGLSPEEAVEVLLGAPVPPADGRIVGGALFPEGGVRVDLTPKEGTPVRRLEFDRDGRLRRVALGTPEGAVKWEARFHDYRRVDGTAFAHRVEFRVPASGTRATVSFRRVELNPPLPPDAFTLRVPPGDRGRREGRRRGS